jgi:hypothetical protein
MSFRPLVHIHTYDQVGNTSLLLGEWNDSEGLEGYCTQSIEAYNKLAPYEPLPLHPNVKKLPLPAIDLGINVSQLLLFWTHTARLSISELSRHVYSQLVASGHIFNDQRSQEGQIEIILVGIDWSPDLRGPEAIDQTGKRHDDLQTKDMYYGIVIERHHGFARRVGIAGEVPGWQWRAAKPKRELVVLM